MKTAKWLLERGLLPDWLLRYGIRRLLRQLVDLRLFHGFYLTFLHQNLSVDDDRIHIVSVRESGECNTAYG